MIQILGGKFKGRKLKTPKGKQTRPTSSRVRTSLFDILAPQIEGADFLDIFAGSGSVGIEALSRGAKSATFIEKNPHSANTIRENLKLLDLEAQLIQADATSAVKRFKKKFDLIYIDPPYDLDISSLLPLLSAILAEDGLIILEQRTSACPEIPLKFLEERTIGDTKLIFLSH